MRKSTIIAIVCTVIACLALAYGIYMVNFAPRPDPKPVPEQTNPVGGDETPAPSDKTDPDDPEKEEGPDGLNEVPVIEDPAPDPVPDTSSGSGSGSGSESGSGSSEKPSGGIPGFSADEIEHGKPGDPSGEQPTVGESTLPEGVDPNGHTGSF